MAWCFRRQSDEAKTKGLARRADYRDGGEQAFEPAQAACARAGLVSFALPKSRAESRSPEVGGQFGEEGGGGHDERHMAVPAMPGAITRPGAARASGRLRAGRHETKAGHTTCIKGSLETGPVARSGMTRSLDFPSRDRRARIDTGPLRWHGERYAAGIEGPNVVE